MNTLLPVAAITAWALASWQDVTVDATALGAAAVIAIATLLSYNLDLEFEFGGHTMELSLGSVPMIAAAVLLEPVLAVPAVAAGAIFLRRDEGDSRIGHLQNILATVTATAGATAAVALVGVDAHGSLALPVTILGALVFETMELLDGVTYLEGRAAGSGVAFLREYRIGLGFSLGLPIIGVALAAPFVAAPIALAVAIACYQGVTWGALKVMQSEQVHRRRSAFLRDSFSRYVPGSVVDQLDERSGAIALGGAMCDITVMFVDVRGFTSWSERQDPAQAVIELNELMTELTQAVFGTAGTLDKFTGDGLMAFWGAPVAQPDHAARACRAAREMRARLAALNARRIAARRMPFRIGIGVHSGPALVGNVGHVDRLDYTAIGDTVNLSARLEAATKDAGCDVLVSSDTLARLDVETSGWLTPHDTISVKGRAAPVEALQLVDGSGDESDSPTAGAEHAA